MLEAAIQMAAQAHDGQLDKGGQPYILHPLRVMLAVPPECRIAAVLHDVLEDGDVNPALIRAKFGSDVADAVKALTRAEGETYRDFIVRCGANDIARMVKMADLTDNMRLDRLGRAPTVEDFARQSKYADAYEYLFDAQAIEARSGETVKQGSTRRAKARSGTDAPKHHRPSQRSE